MDRAYDAALLRSVLPAGDTIALVRMLPSREATEYHEAHSATGDVTWHLAHR